MCSKRLRTKVVFLSVFVFLGCALATTELFTIKSNLDKDNSAFNDEYVIVSFSDEPNKTSLEDLLVLNVNGSPIPVRHIWNDKSVSIIPVDGWQPGQRYHLTVIGNILLRDERMYSVSFDRFFYRDRNDYKFELIEYYPQDGSSFDSTLLLTFKFNDPVNRTSFLDDFTINPNEEYYTNFLDNDCTVEIKPKNSWQENTSYQWSLKNTVSQEGYPLLTPQTGKVIGIKESDIPCVLAVCPVDCMRDDVWHEKLPVENNLSEFQPIGILFSCPMDRQKTIQAITLKPSWKGYVEEAMGAPNRFIFKPTEPFTSDTRYKLTIASSATALSGLTLKNDYLEFFSPGFDFLYIENIDLGSNISISDFSNSDLIYEYSTAGSIAETRIQFSTEIGKKERAWVVSLISLTSIFPSTALYPHLTAVHWNDTGEQVSLLWENFTTDSEELPCFYMLTVQGGKKGITNGTGRFLQEDVCIVLKLR